MGAAAGEAEATTILDFVSPYTALICPSASSKILTPDTEYAASVATESSAAAAARSISAAPGVEKFG
jgi:hypothetical protein